MQNSLQSESKKQFVAVTVLAFCPTCLSKYQVPNSMHTDTGQVHSSCTPWEWSPVEKTEVERIVRKSEVGPVFWQAGSEHLTCFKALEVLNINFVKRIRKVVLLRAILHQHPHVQREVFQLHYHSPTHYPLHERHEKQLNRERTEL